MKIEHKDIIIGSGLGKLKFGMTRDEVKKLLGKPDEQEVTSYSEDEKDMNDSWVYYDLELDLSFDEAEDWRLVIISVTAEEYAIQDRQLIGMPLEDLMIELSEMNIGDLVIEDMSSEEQPDHKLVSSESTGMNFWLDANVLEEIQWGPLFIDDDTIDWPK